MEQFTVVKPKKIWFNLVLILNGFLYPPFFILDIFHKFLKIVLTNLKRIFIIGKSDQVEAFSLCSQEKFLFFTLNLENQVFHSIIS